MNAQVVKYFVRTFGQKAESKQEVFIKKNFKNKSKKSLSVRNTAITTGYEFLSLPQGYP